MPKISIVTPTYNEVDNIEILANKIQQIMENHNYDYEHIIIDNNSVDGTISLLKKLAALNKKIKVIINARNFGHIRSPIYGIFQSSGDATILLNSDLQEPPELISKYIKEWETGYDVVLGQRKKVESNYLMNFFKSLFYKLLKKISDVNLTEGTTGTGLFSKKIVENLKKIDDPYPYFRGLLTEISSNIKLVPYDQLKRNKGNSKNNFYSLYDYAILGLIKHSKVPLRIVTFLGFFASFISLLIAIIFFIKKLLFWNDFQLGTAPLIIGLFSIASIQIFLLGFIGEYVMSIFTQVRKLPLVVEKERINFD